ncbi:MAG: type I DNA topoisomerase [Patescibacteria group bacterium]|nr:type I DNA topoisomerase [Patescibacteria group bacterium]
MANLVVVESPTKAKTILKYLGDNFEVESSRGHIKDLPKSELGVDVESDFEPKYVVVKGKSKIIDQLKKAASKADEVWLATDLDREGEAIACHLAEVLAEVTNSKVQDFKRVVFHEITESAIKASFEDPRGVDFDLVDAQKARRVLDRLVGYKLSPLLWKKVRGGLSAGRVQSVAVRFVVERENERESFQSDKYWSLESLFAGSGDRKFWAELKEVNGESIEKREEKELFAGKYQITKTTIDTKERLEEVKKAAEKSDFSVSSVTEKEIRRKPYPPLTTSSLQASAASLGFSSSKTMRIAQRLYEEGFITYHRTDSEFLSSSAIKACRVFVKNNLGEEYLPESPVRYQTKSKTAQEAHEAIRPTDVTVKPGAVRKLGQDEFELYNLIWRQTVASQMKPAVFSRTTVDVLADGNGILFRGVGRILKFDGWLKIRPRIRKRTKENEIPIFEEGETAEVEKLKEEKHQTAPPPRYSEATLIKELKEYGIGRPSTYAPIISTIQKREYVQKEGGYFVPTDIGKVVTGLLIEHFPTIVDVDFTAEMENSLDKVASGKVDWKKIIREFWEPFSDRLKEKMEEIERSEVTVLEETDEKCPECGRPLVVKLGKYGKFLSCSGFPECEYARPFSDVDEDGVPDDIDEEQLEGECPKCGGDLELREGRYGKFISCSNYPECKFTKNYLDKIGMKCPECGEGEVVVKKTRRGKTFYGCSRYPDCEFASWKNPKKSSK